MGRRKIEIQPITHERNRSVTFLKRKNGLFKKAYELGVLCSVDVAVIIFEERPGHQVKLYEYCSGSVRDIVRRHGKHDGDKDSRGPADFGPGGKTVDEDADEDDEEEEPKVPAKRRASGRLKTAPSAPPPIDEDFPSPPAPPTRIPPPPPPPVRRHEQKRQRVEHSPPPATPVPHGRGRGHVHQNQNHSRSSSAASVGAAPSSAHPSTPFYDTPPAYNAQFFQQQQQQQQQQPPPQPFGFGGGGGGGSGYQSNRPSYMPLRDPPEELFGFMGGGGGGGSGGGGGAGFEWPVHQQHQQQPQQAPPSARNPAGWLDFLSNNNPTGGRTSWERGGPGPGGTVHDLLSVLEHSKEGTGG